MSNHSRVTHKARPRLTENFIDGFTGWKNGAQGIGAAKKLLIAAVAAIGDWLQLRGDGAFVELEGFEKGQSRGLLHVRNIQDFRVITIKALGDSILQFDGRELFLLGPSGAERLAAAILGAVESLTKGTVGEAATASS
jgi:hypothetical protein